MKFLLIFLSSISFYAISGLVCWLLSMLIGIGPTIIFTLACISVFIGAMAYELTHSQSDPFDK